MPLCVHEIVNKSFYVEVIAHGKVEWPNSTHAYFVRAIAVSKDDPIGRPVKRMDSLFVETSDVKYDVSVISKDLQSDYFDLVTRFRPLGPGQPRPTVIRSQ